MKALAFLLTCLFLSSNARAAEMNGLKAPPSEREPTNGLAKLLLSPGELDSGLRRQIRFLVDSQSSPSLYYPLEPHFQEPPQLAPDPDSSALPFMWEAARLKAEALVYVAYGSQNTWYYMQIVRFATAKQAEEHWLNRRKEGQSTLVGTAAGNVIWTRAGQELRLGAKAHADTVERKEGNYLVSLAPCRPFRHDPGLELLLRQIEKIENSSQGDVAGEASQPAQSETNGARSTVARDKHDRR